MSSESPLVFAEPNRFSELSRAVRAGKARRLARGLYTDDLRADPAQLIRRHWLEVVAHSFPGAVITDRSRLRALPDERGFLFVVSDRERLLHLPGLIIVPRKGKKALSDDVPLPGGIWLSSIPRALVENLLPSRAVKGRPRRTLTQTELDEWVARLLRVEGRDRLTQIRVAAKDVAKKLGLSTQLPRLDRILGAALGTRKVKTRSPALSATQQGRAYDERRDSMFKVLAEFLEARAPAPRTVLDSDRKRLTTQPFFEAYFSNFIEGTEFTVEEARRIVFNGAIPSARPADAHDVLGTYAVVSDEGEMRRVPTTVDDLVDLLRARHARLLSARPEKRPGELKARANRAGSSEFVAPHLVIGTLARGFERMRRLEDPFSRAAFIMFLVAEVHPFDDGNGRIARIMMNAELYAETEHRIIVPTVYRTEYLSALRAMTHNSQPGPLSRMLDFAQRYTQQVDYSTYDRAKRTLTATHAFVDPAEALDRGIRLTLPLAPD